MPRRKKVTPAVEETIRQYFLRGFNAREIRDFLMRDGVNISHSHLRCRVMPGLGLIKSRWNRPTALEVAEAVVVATAEGSAQRASTAAVTRALRVEMELNVVARDVAQAQRALAPQLVAERRTGRLHRRTYHTEGSNYLWHCDGYDKLSPYGIPIHGGIDGFSRYILWLEVAYTNRRPEQTCQFFLRAVARETLPHSMRTDAGTENTYILQAMRYLSADLPRITQLNCALSGSSNHNERIERLWGLLRYQKINWWIDHFKDLSRQGHIIAWDAIDRKVSYFTYHRLIRKELRAFRKYHNDHRIRKQKVDIRTGKPEYMYRFPEKYGLRECGRGPSQVKLDACRLTIAADVPFDPRYQRVLSALCQQFGLQYPPLTIQDANTMYLRLRTEMHALLD